MVSADERAAVEFSLAEQRALMRAAALECAPSAAGPHQDDVDSVRGQRERPWAVEFAEIGDANECFGLHDQTLTGRDLGRCSCHDIRRRAPVLLALPHRSFYGGLLQIPAPGFDGRRCKMHASVPHPPYTPRSLSPRILASVVARRRRTLQAGRPGGVDATCDGGATSAPIAQRIDQQGEGRRRLPAARIVEVVAREGRAPVGEHPDERPSARCGCTWSSGR